jgi:hypothetical protein
MKALVILAFATAANASYMSGNELHTRLNGSEQDRAIAVGYIAGVADAYSGIAHCSPPSVTVGQVVDMTVYVLEKMPEYRHMPADQIIGQFLNQAWPCEKKPVKRESTRL